MFGGRCRKERQYVNIERKKRKKKKKKETNIKGKNFWRKMLQRKSIIKRREKIEANIK